jgi:hypothetical protein
MASIAIWRRNADMMASDSASKGVPAPKAAVLGAGALIGLGGLRASVRFQTKARSGMIAPTRRRR